MRPFVCSFTEVAEDSACHFYPTTENYVIIVAFTIIFALSVIGNALVVIVVLQVGAPLRPRKQFY